LNRERVNTHYVLRYVYAILAIITIAVAIALGTLYLTQQDERLTHERLQLYHLESVSVVDEVRREVLLLHWLVHQATSAHAPDAAGPAGISAEQVSSTGLLQSLRIRVQRLSFLEQQYGGPALGATIQRMTRSLEAISSDINADNVSADTLMSIDVLLNGIEQFIRLHKIEARGSLQALAARQSEQPRFFAVLLACLAFIALVGGYLILSLRSSLERQYETEAALAESQERLHHIQKLDALGRLVGGVAHDFNNLLTIILGHVEILLLTKPDEAAVRAGLGEIRKAGDRAATLTQQLLAFSRRQQLQPKVLDLNAQVAGLESLLRRIVSEDVRLEVRYATNPCAIEVDPDQLRQIVMNLVGNARDAMPDGGQLEIGTHAIEVDTATNSPSDLPPGTYMRLTVADTGVGMGDDVLQRIFEPFFTTKEETRGTGLGLSTVHGVVKGSGGHIEVESSVGEGSAFHVYFPRTDKSPEGPLEGSGQAQLQRGSETVLIVEDDESVLQFVEMGLTSLGYTVRTAAGGSTGLEICERAAGAIDVILSDIVMPEMSGPEFMEKALALCPTVVPIFMSAYTREKALRSGNADFANIPLLNKPFQLEELARLIRQQLP